MRQRLVVGGSELLREFFDEARDLPGADVHVLTPYADDGAFLDDVIGPAWRHLVRTTRVVVVVRTPAAVDAILRASGGDASCFDLRVNPRLHAKVFVAWRAEGLAVALLGSHNLTGAALHTNTEAGVYVRAGLSPWLRAFVADLREFTTLTIRDSTMVSGANSIEDRQRRLHYRSLGGSD